jgi:uncharacterized membrane protein YdjX (TVP38/TMEM64 family)
MAIDTPKDPGPRRLIVNGVLIAVALAVGWIIFERLGLDDYIRDYKALKQALGPETTHGPSLFFLIATLLMGLGFSKHIIAMAAGYLYGLTYGLGLTMVASTVGSAVPFYYARYLGRALVARKLSDRWRRIDDLIADNPFTATLIIRWFPISSNIIVNLLAGVSSMRAVPFIGATIIAQFPHNFIFCLIGTGVQQDQTFMIMLGAVLYAVSCVLAYALYVRYRDLYRKIEKPESPEDTNDVYETTDTGPPA